MSWNIYDRLITHGMKTLPDGTLSYDFTQFKPELAESWEIAPDRTSVTFHLRKDATFHDGSPVTAEDVKWSFDRAVSVGGFPGHPDGRERHEVARPVRGDRSADDPGRLSQAEQARTAQPRGADRDDRQFQARQAACDRDDPWALDWVGKNDAGGGAYMVESWKPGSEIVFKRFDAWKSGPLPAMKKVIERQIELAGTRRALLEKGDADLSFNLPPKDFAELAKEGKLKVIGTQIDAELLYMDMNVTKPPFDNPKVRQAMAYAIPYQDILHTGLMIAASACSAARAR